MIGKSIRELREGLDMSQEELASRIGLARPALTQIENGSRKVSADELLAFSRALNVSMEQLMGIKSAPQVSIAQEGGTRLIHKAEQHEMRISVPQKNLEKFRQVLLYVLNKVGAKPNMGETVLYKLLYFMDFNYYEKYEEQLIGATYIKNHYGPTPVEFKKVVERMFKDGEITRVKSRYFNFPQTKYLPRKAPDLSVLSGREIELIDQVLNHLSDMNAAEISDYSHGDVPWMAAEDGEVIRYESAFYRTPNYSMRVYGEGF